MTYIYGIADPLNWNAPKRCGWTECAELAEQGYGRCRKHKELYTCMQCGKPLDDPEYAPYLVCSSKCDELNCRDEDEEQQS